MKIKFVPQNIEVDIDPNKSVMKLAHENGIAIKSVCNGLPSCAECRVNILEGDQNLLPPTGEELALIGTGYFVDHRRLSCQLKCYGDVVIDLSEQVEKEQQQGARHPQGNLKKDSTETSLAITGNLLDAEKELLSDSDLNINEDGVKPDDLDGDVIGLELRSGNKKRPNNKKRNSKSNRNSKSARPGNTKSQGKKTSASKEDKPGPNKNRTRRKPTHQSKKSEGPKE